MGLSWCVLFVYFYGQQLSWELICFGNEVCPKPDLHTALSMARLASLVNKSLHPSYTISKKVRRMQ
jgi:hypothetical protein